MHNLCTTLAFVGVFAHLYSSKRVWESFFIRGTKRDEEKGDVHIHSYQSECERSGKSDDTKRAFSVMLVIASYVGVYASTYYKYNAPVCIAFTVYAVMGEVMLTKFASPLMPVLALSVFYR